MHISKKQLRLLGRIAKHSVVRTDALNIEDIEYLRENGLVTAAQYDKSGDYFYQPRITEKGKAFLYEKCHANRRANIALFLSVVSLAVSLLSAFTPVPEWIKAFISSLLQSL